MNLFDFSASLHAFIRTFSLSDVLVILLHRRCRLSSCLLASLTGWVRSSTCSSSASTLVAKLDIAGARNRSLTFPSLASCGHVTSFDSAVREKPISAVVSQIVAISAADFALRSISCFTCAIVRSTSPLLMSLPSVIYRGSAARILIP